MQRRNNTIVFPRLECNSDQARLRAGGRFSPRRWRWRIVLAVLVLVCPSLLALSLDARGGDIATVRVTDVIDGDSLAVAQGKTTYQVRLWGVDAPEYDQEGAEAATSWLQEMTAGATVELQRKYTDRYGRTVALVWAGGTLLNEALVGRGLAWVHRRYCDERICETWLHLEQQAQARRSGIWAGDRPIAPWQWKVRRNRQPVGRQ